MLANTMQGRQFWHLDLNFMVPGLRGAAEIEHIPSVGRARSHQNRQDRGVSGSASREVAPEVRVVTKSYMFGPFKGGRTDGS